jgi:RHS repeat-associated protein
MSFQDCCSNPSTGNGGDSQTSSGAYLQWIFLKSNNTVDTGKSDYKAVTTASADKFAKLEADPLVFTEAGKLYVYIANESDELVHFDDFKITHHKTGSSFKVNQASDYYPYGLRMATSWDRNPESANNRLYNAGNERNATTGWDETYFRMYDPAIGRFHGVDPLAVKYAGMTPYNYVGGNPIAFNDPLGDDYFNEEGDWVEWDQGCGCYNAPAGGGSPNGRAWKQTGMSLGSGGYGGMGVGSGNHWSNSLKTTSQNAAMMSSNTFMNYYGINQSKLSDGDYLMEVANKIGDRIDIYENWIDWYQNGEFIGATFQNYGIKSSPKITFVNKGSTNILQPGVNTKQNLIQDSNVMYDGPGAKITLNLGINYKAGLQNAFSISKGKKLSASKTLGNDNLSATFSEDGISLSFSLDGMSKTLSLTDKGVNWAIAYTIDGMNYGMSLDFQPKQELAAAAAVVLIATQFYNPGSYVAAAGILRMAGR